MADTVKILRALNARPVEMVEKPLFKFGKAIFGVVFTTIITSLDPRISSKRNRMQVTLKKEPFLTWAMILLLRYFYKKKIIMKPFTLVFFFFTTLASAQFKAGYIASDFSETVPK